MRVATLEEYVQARRFIDQAEAIIARANAEARELTGSDQEALVGLDGLRQKVSRVREQVKAFELVQELQARGAATSGERERFAYALCSMFEIDSRDLGWKLREPGGLDSWMAEHGIGRRTFFDLTRFRELHPAVAPEAEVQEAVPQRRRSSRPGSTGESRPR